MVVNKDGVIEQKSQAGLLYADDVYLMASNEQDLQMIFDNISGCISEYGMKVSERKSKVVCINGAKEERRLNFRLQTTQHTRGGAVTAVWQTLCKLSQPLPHPAMGVRLPIVGKPVMRTRWMAGNTYLSSSSQCGT